MDGQTVPEAPHLSTWPQLKIARAMQHLADLHSRMNLWSAAAPYTVEPHISEDRTTVSFRLKVVVPPPTDEWSLYLGDSLHALRSALDACVWELAHMEGATPSKPRRIGFPDCRREDAWDEMRKDKLQTVSEMYAERVKQVQPFRTHPQQPNTSALAVLSYLDNRDKHRASIQLHMDGNAIQQGFQVRMMEGEDGEPLEVVGHFAPVEDGALILECRYAGRIDSVSGDFGLGMDVSFETELGREGISAVDGMILEVRRMLAFILAARPAAERDEPAEEPVWQEMTFIPSQDNKSARYAPER